MGDTRGPVRHRRSSRRAGNPPDARTDKVALPLPCDLQAVFTALALRAKLPTGPEATPAAVLRAAGLPLLMATIVAAAQPLPAQAVAAPGPAAPQSAPDPWTVTNLATTHEIVTLNGLRPGEEVKPGQVLVLPPPIAESAGVRPANSARPAPATPSTTYTVQDGDTVIDIARRRGRDPAGIITLNDLPSDGLIRPGDVLKLPPEPAATPAAPATRPYVVREGDTLIDICTRDKVVLRKVLALNHLTMDSVIRPGQRLLLPAPPARATSNNTFAGRTYPPTVVAAADANRRALARRIPPSREQARKMIIATSRRHGLDPALVLAIAYQESGFSQRVVSPANAVGVMQVTPSAGAWASDLLGNPLNLLDAQDNITAGVVLLRALRKGTTSEPQAIAGYYQGLASVRKHGMFADTRRYVANVQTLRSRFAKSV